MIMGKTVIRKAHLSLSDLLRMILWKPHHKPPLKLPFRQDSPIEELGSGLLARP